MDLPELFKEYLLSKKNPASKATVKNYLADIKSFISWFEKVFQTPFTPNAVNNKIITAYKTNRSDVSQRSMARHLSSLRAFFAFLQETNQISKNPFNNPEAESHEPQTSPWKIKEFKSFLFTQKAAHLTIKNYITDVQSFKNWYEKTVGFLSDPTDITPGILYEYRERLVNNSALAPRSINRKLSSLRRYSAFIQADLSSVLKKIEDKTSEKNAGISLETISQEEKASEKYTKSGWSPFGFYLRLEEKAAGKLVKFIKSTNFMPAKKIARLFYESKHAPQILNLKKSFYAAHSVSISTYPLHRKIYHHARFTRPNWYKRYHNYPFVHYLHFAVLVIYAAAVGFMLYQGLFGDAKKPTFAAPAQPLKVYSFQGRLTDASDNPITTSKQIRFVLYNDSSASGAAELWEEVRTISPDSDGIFSVLLASQANGTNAADCGTMPPASPVTGACGIPQSLFRDNAQLWLGVTVTNDSELTPRQQLATVAYATNAEVLQGLPPITQSGAGTSNVVLALDSSGNLTIGGSATPTFSASGGQFTLSGQTLLLTTATGTNTNVRITPDGLGKIDLQRPLINTGVAGNLVPGGVEINDKFGILATESAVAAFVLNNNGSSDLFTASASGTPKFTISNTGALTSAAYTNAGGILYTATTGLIGQTAIGTASQCLLGGTTPSFGSCATGTSDQYWNQTSGALFPNNSTVDFFIGGQATSSADFAVLNVNGTGPATATVSGNMIIMPNNGAGGNLGIGTTSPLALLHITRPDTDSIQTNLILGNRSTGVSAGTAIDFRNHSTETVNTARIIAQRTTAANSNSTLQFWNFFGGSLQEGMRINESGNVGIGTTTPTTTLDITGSASVSANLGFRGAATAHTLNIFDNGTLNIQRSPGGDAGLTTALFVQNNGNVGIGTSSPADKLSIYTTPNGGYAGANIQSSDTTTGSKLRLQFLSSGGVQLSSIEQPADLNYQLSIINNQNHQILLKTGTTSSANNNIVFQTSGSNERVRIDYLGNVGIGTTTPTSELHVTRPLSFGTTGKSLAIFDQIEEQDILTASKSGVTKFTISNTGAITSAAYTGQNAALYGTQTTGVVAQATTSTANLCLVSGASAPSWGSCASGLSSDVLWSQNSGLLYSNNSTVDFAIGGTATTSAKFAVLNINGSATPVASISANSGNIATYLTGDGTLATTNRGTLTIGNSSTYNTTGNILLNPSGGGLVGIGTNSPTATMALDVNGSARIATNLLLGTNSSIYTSGYSYPISIDASNLLINTASGGNVGIGTTSPDAILHSQKANAGGDSVGLMIENSGQSGVTTSSIVFAGNGGGGVEKARIKAAVYGDGYMTFHTNDDTEKMRITATGSVGIGTTGPYQKLDVLSGGGGTQLRLTSTDGSVYTDFKTDQIGDLTITPSGGDASISGSLQVASTANIAGDSTHLRVKALTGATYGTKLSLDATDLSGGNTWELFSTSTAAGEGAGKIIFYNRTTSTYGITQQANGNVGIGDTSPTALLTVGSGDLFQVNSSGAIAAATGLTSSGTITFSGLNGQNAALYGTQTTGVLAQATTSTANLCLVSGASAPSWGSCASGTNVSPFQQGAGFIYPNNSTSDFLIGAQASTSAKFAVLNVNSGTPTASVSAGTAGGAYLSATGTLATTAKQTLTLGDTNTGEIKVGTDATARTISLGNSTGASALNFTSGTGSQTFTSSVATGTTTTSGFVFDATAINSGTGLYATTDSITTGKLAQFATTGNTLTTGTLLDLRSTATSLTGAVGTGSILNLDWSPGSSTTATGDLFSLNIGTNGTTTGNLFNILDTGSSLFSVSETAMTSNLPASFTSAGDVSIAYDLNFTNPTASYIKSAAPLYIQAGETYNSTDLTLGTYNKGNTIVDSEAFVTNYSATVSGQLVVGTSTAPSNIGNFYLTNSAVFGKALAILNQTESQDILTGSASGTTKFSFDNSGNLKLAAGTTLDTLSSGTLGIGTTNATTLTLGRSGQGITLPGFTGQNAALYGTQTTGVLAQATTSTANLCLVSGASAPTWGSCASGLSNDVLWGQNSGLLYANNTTVDFALGGTSTTSAKFAVLNINGSGTPVASISAQNAAGQALSLSSDGTIQTTRGNTLNIGGTTTGLINVVNKSGSAFTTFDTVNSRVGIGTTAPNRDLVIYSGTDIPHIQLASATSGTTTTDGFQLRTISNAAYLTNFENTNMYFGNNAASTQITIDTTGNFGINTTTPTAKLDITGSASVSANLGFRGAGTAHTLNIFDNGTLNIQRSPGGDAGLTTALFVQNNGNVGIGTTSPDEALGLIGNMRIFGAAGNTEKYIDFYADSTTGGGEGAQLGRLTFKGRQNPSDAASFQIKLYNQSSSQIESPLFIKSAGMIGLGTSSPISELHVTRPLSSTITGKALAIFDQIEEQDIFTASKSGVTKFTISNTGAITSAAYTGNNAVLYGTTTSGIVTSATTNTSNLCLVSGTGAGYAPSWGSCASGLSSDVLWSQNSGLLYPNNSTVDFAIGGTATTSAKFAVLNINGSATPVASISAQNAAGQALTLSGDGTIQTTRGNTLTLGGTATGVINVNNKSGSAFTTFDTVNSRVGIGTTAPATYLHIIQSDNTGLRLQRTESSSYRVDLFAQYSDTDSLRLQVSGQNILSASRFPVKTSLYTFNSGGTPDERLTIDNSGNVGINTTTPNTKLDVVGSASVSANLGFRGATTAHTLNIFDNGTLNIQRSPGGDAGLTTALFVNSNNYVGIGTTVPAYRLHVKRAATDSPVDFVAKFEEASDDDVLAVFSAGGASESYDLGIVNSNFVIREQSGSTGIALDPSGNVGIGDTSPASMFTVGSGDLFQVNSSGAIAAATGLTSSGTITFSGLNGQNGALYGTQTTGVLAQATTSTANLCLISGASAPTWGSCSSGLSNDVLWSQNSGLLYANNTTVDFALGGTSTTSANFAVLNNNSGIPVATVAGNFIVMPKTSGVSQLGGKVGIGTTNPQTKLHIYDNSTNTTGQEELRLESSYTNAGSGPMIRFTNAHASGTNPNSGEYNLAGIYAYDYDSNWGGALAFQTPTSGTVGGGNLSTRMVISPSGNVGIGTTGPNYPLEVNRDTTTNDLVNIRTGSVDMWTIGREGGVGASKLSAQGSQILVAKPGATYGIAIGPGVTWSDLATSGNINLKGNVGIGTTAPTSALDIAGSASVSANLGFNGAATAHTLNIFDNGTLNIQRSPGGDAGLATALFIQNNGNVGIGTTEPTSLLHITGSTVHDYTPNVIGIQIAGVSDGNPAIEMTSNGGTPYIDFQNDIVGTDYDVRLILTGNDSLAVMGGSIYSPSFIDYDNNSYYLDPAGTTSLLVAGSVGIGGDTTPDSLFNVGATSQFQVNSSGAIATATGLTSSGTITFSGLNGQNAALYGTQTTGVLAQATTSTANLCLISGASAPTWGACSSGLSNDVLWSQNSGLLYPNNSTVDFAIGGTSTTSAKFKIQNIASGTPVASISANSGNNATYLTGDGTLATTNRQTLTIGNSSTYDTTGNVLINPNGTGNVGIGTTDPTALLTVQAAGAGAGQNAGQIVIKGTSTAEQLGLGYYTAGDYSWIQSAEWGVNYRPLALQPSGGNVGIGDTSPLAMLTVGSGDLFQVISTGEVRTIAGAVGTPSYSFTADTDTGIWREGTDRLSFTTGGINRMSISSAGTIEMGGSGTTGISANFLQNTSNVNYLEFSGATTGNNINVQARGTDTNVAISIQGKGSGNILLNSSTTGNVGIGITAPTALLHVNGGNTGGNSALIVNQTGASGNDILTASASGTTRMTLNNAGQLALATQGSTGGLVIGGDTTLYRSAADTLKTDDDLSVAGGQVYISGTGPGLFLNNGTVQATALALGAGASPDLTLNNSNTTMTFSNAGVLSGLTGLTLASGAINVGGSDGTTSLCLIGGATASWGSCASGTNVSPFQQGAGFIFPNNSTSDFLIGGQATTSAKFAILNVNSGTPTASVSANSGNIATYLTGDGTLATTNRQTLTIGNSSTYNTTGNVLINPNGTGNVGIGTTGPSYKLDLQSTNAYDAFVISPTTGTNTSSMRFHNTGNDFYLGLDNSAGSQFQATSAHSTYAGSLYLGSARDLIFYTNAAERMTILSGGNVGINTTAPTTTLDITGSASISANLGFRGAATAHTLNIFDNGTLNIQRSPGGDAGLTTAMFINSGGNIGISNSNPQNTLDIIRTNSSTTAFSSYSPLGLRNTDATNNNWTEIGFFGGNNIAAGIAAQNINQASSYANLAFFTRGASGWSQKMTILSDGNVGIGDTSPASMFTVGSGDLFQVNSSGAIAAATGLTSSGTITFSGFTSNGGPLYTNGSGVLAQVTAGTSSQCLLGGTTPSFGSCATGTTDAFWNQSSGALFPSNSTVDLLIGSQATSSADFAVLNVNGTGAATATVSGNMIVMPKNGAGGNVGIGTITPSQKLDVSGTTKTNSLLANASGDNYAHIVGSLATGENGIIGNNVYIGKINKNLFKTDSEIPTISSCGGTGIGVCAYAGTWDQNITTSTTLPTGLTGVSYSVNHSVAGGDFRPIVYDEPGVDLAGRTFTVSVWVKADAGATGTIAWSSAYPDDSNQQTETSPTLTTSWQRVSFTRTMPAGSAGADFRSYFGIPVHATARVHFWGMQIEEASVLTPYEKTNGTQWSGGGSGFGFWASDFRLGGTPAVPNSYWDNTNNRLGIGNTSPTTNLDITGSASVSANLGFRGAATAHTLNIFDNGTLNIQRSPGGDAGLTTAMYIKENGNVGIGTTNPGAMLHVDDGDATYGLSTRVSLLLGTNTSRAGAIKLQGITSGGYGLIQETTNNLHLDTVGGSTYLNYYDGDNVYFGNGASGATGIWKSSSEVGIGTTTAPHGGIGYAKLAIDGTNSSSAGPHIQYTTASDDYPLFQQLNWTHDNIALNFDAYYDGTWKSADAGSNFQIYKVGDLLKFTYDSGIAAGSAVTWNDGLAMNSSGNVGIGTTTPTAKLDITGSASVSANLGFRGAATAHTLNIFDNGTLNIQRSPGGDAGLTTALFVQNNGNVGIGTTGPGAMLSIGVNQTTTDKAQLILNDDALFRGEFGYNEAGTTIMHIANTYNNNAARFDIRMKGSAAANTVMTILGSGNVGIGTTAPDAALEINHATGDSLRLTYNDSDGSATSYTDFSLASDGDLTIDSSGGGITFPDASITMSTFTTNGGLLYTNGSGLLTQLTSQGSVNNCLLSNGAGAAPSFAACPAGTETIDAFWNQSAGALFPNNSTVDFLIGGQASTSAKFAVLNVNNGTPVASVSSGLSGNSMYMTADGTLATQRRQSLTIGNSSTYNTTGNVLINPNGTGNVGIGTSAPGNKLSVNGNVSIPNAGFLGFMGDTAVTASNYALYGSTTETLLNVVTGGSLAFRVNNATKMIVDTNGLVGIGDTGPDAKLEVLSTTEQLRLTYTDDTVDSRFTVDSSGNLTIDNTGTKTIIADDLQVTGNDILDSAAATRITLGATTTLTNTGLTLSGTTAITASSLATLTSASTLTISGTVRAPAFYDSDNLAYFTDPAATAVSLKVAGDASASGSLVFDGSNKSIDILNDSRLDFQTSPGGDAGLTARMTLMNNGNVGIGTTAPKARLQLVDDTTGDYRSALIVTNVETDNAAKNARIGTLHYDVQDQPFYGMFLESNGTDNILSLGGGTTLGKAASEIRFYIAGNPITTSGTEIMRIESTGNVGIRTTAPDAALEINHATGDSLRLTYNDADGSAANYTDFSLASDGDLTIDSSGNNITLGTSDLLTIPGVAGSYALSITAGDATLVDGSLTLKDTDDAATLDITNNTVSTANAVSISATGITTGKGLSLVGPASTGVITGATAGFLNVASDVGSAGTAGILAYFDPDFSAGSATTSNGIKIDGTDSTAIGNSDYNLYSGLALTGNAAKTGVGIYSTVSSTSTTGDTLYGIDLLVDHNGALSGSSNKKLYGIKSQVNNDGITDSSIFTNVDIYGGYFDAIGNTGGVQAAYGVYIADISGADTNVALCFDCDGTFATTTVAAGIQFGTDTTTTQNVSIFRSNGAAAAQLTIEDGAGTDLIVAATAGVQVNLQDSDATERLCHSGADGATAMVTLGDCAVAGADFAEYFGSDGTVVPGDIVIADGESEIINNESYGVQPKTFVKKSTSVYQPTIGIVSTNPYNEVLGNRTFTPQEHPVPIALNGQVPVKVSTENGPIAAGDFITSSSTPGVGMKATRVGRVIGMALEDYNPQDSNQEGKIIVFVNPSWYDPRVLIAMDGSLSITGSVLNLGNLAALSFQTATNSSVLAAFKAINNTTGSIIDEVAGYSKAVIGVLESGFIQTQILTAKTINLTTDNMTIAGKSLQAYIADTVQNILATNYLLPATGETIVSPLASIDQIHTNIISPLADNGEVKVNGKLVIAPPVIASDSAAISLEVLGSASISGDLAAQTGQFNNLTVQQFNNLGDASVSGTLRAGKIIAGDIEGLNARLDSLVSNSVDARQARIATLAAEQVLSSKYNVSSISGELDIASILNTGYFIPDTDFVDIQSISSDFATFRDGLMSLGPTTLSQVTVLDSLSIGTNFTIGQNSINLLGEDLQIQSLKQGGVSFLAGLVHIDTEGNLKVAGNAQFAKDVTVHGKLSSNIISPLPGSDLNLSLPSQDTKYQILNASSSAVLSVNQTGDVVASGAATFNKLNLNLAAPAFATSDITAIATGSAGSAFIKRARTELTIENPNVTEKSLIYITPVGNANQALYLLRQTAEDPETSEVEGSFTVGVGASLPATGDTKFNWLIVN